MDHSRRTRIWDECKMTSRESTCARYRILVCAAYAARAMPKTAGRGRVGKGRATRSGQGKNLSPAVKRHAVNILKGTSQNGWRARWLGWHTSTYRRLPIAQTPADPDATAGLRHQHPSQGFRRAWAALRYDERREANKKVHRALARRGTAGAVTQPAQTCRGHPAHPGTTTKSNHSTAGYERKFVERGLAWQGNHTRTVGGFDGLHDAADEPRPCPGRGVRPSVDHLADRRHKPGLWQGRSL